MPCDIGCLPVIAGEDPAAHRRINEVMEDSANWLTGVTADALIPEAVDNSASYRLENAAALADRPLLCVTGSLDIYTPAPLHALPLLRAIQTAGGMRARHTSYPTDRFFADYRLTVAREVIRFLQGIACEAPPVQ